MERPPQNLHNRRAQSLTTTMRLRLVHTLSLCLVAAVAASVLAMGVVMAWNLRQGFGDYLAARDTAERAELGDAARGDVEQAIEDLRAIYDSFASQAGLGPS